MQCVLRGAVRAGGEVTQTAQRRVHRCRMLCASHASSLAWEWCAWPRQGRACCSHPLPASWQVWAA
eukprot:6192420-Pleurochrysis_carterae.AAC.1